MLAPSPPAVGTHTLPTPTLHKHRCEPVDHCVYQYRFLDATFSESCRMRDPPPHTKPLYWSKIMGHPVRSPPFFF